jgi:hypothetical protein
MKEHQSLQLLKTLVQLFLHQPIQPEPDTPLLDGLAMKH